MQSRLARALARTAVVSWREHPTQYDIESLRANIERVGLVIRVRWAIVAALSIFSVIAAYVYAQEVPFTQFVTNMTVPAFALVFVMSYNTFYQMTYRKVGNVSFLNQAQLIFDIIVTTVLVYYSGGVYSWFSAMYLLFILEGAFILPKKWHVWMLVTVSAVLYGFVLGAEYLRWIPHVDVPFVTNHLFSNGTYVLVRYLWKVTMYGGAGTIGILMMQRIHVREKELQESSFVDETTGLFNRPYFHRVLAAEIERARRGGRDLAIMVADVHKFAELNRVFGLDVGDEILAALGGVLREVSRDEELDEVHDLHIACRVGGEEMAIIVPQFARYEGEVAPAGDRAMAMAEKFRSRVEALRVRGLSVTVSVGVAVFPADGDTFDSLVDAADRALYEASDAGGNRVVSASTLDQSEEDDEQ
jgi:diguanylate cyclase (GGDEF)-like protein